MERREEHIKKAAWPMEVIEVGITNLLSEVQA